MAVAPVLDALGRRVVAPFIYFASDDPTHAHRPPRNREDRPPAACRGPRIRARCSSRSRSGFAVQRPTRCWRPRSRRSWASTAIRLGGSGSCARSTRVVGVPALALPLARSTSAIVHPPPTGPPSRRTRMIRSPRVDTTTVPRGPTPLRRRRAGRNAHRFDQHRKKKKRVPSSCRRSPSAEFGVALLPIATVTHRLHPARPVRHRRLQGPRRACRAPTTSTGRPSSPASGRHVEPAYRRASCSQQRHQPLLAAQDGTTYALRPMVGSFEYHDRRRGDWTR